MENGVLHVAIVVAGLGAGGAERVISLLSGGWVAEGRRVTVIAFDREDDPLFHPLDARVEVIRLGIGSGGVRAVLRRCRALRQVLDRLVPDITLSFLTKINVLTLLACLGRRRRVIVSERNNPRMQKASGGWNLAFRWLSGGATAIVMQTHASLECLGPAARRRAIVIPNPIMVGAVRREEGPSRVLAAVGRLTWQKGFDRLIDAFARVADRHPDWTLRIWGEGEARAALEDRIAGHGLGDRIMLPGTSRSPDAWVAEADAFVLSSRFEGFCNALGEAMAAGLPVVSFDCAYGPAEVIRHGEDGLLVRDGDVDALAAALDRLLENATLRTRLGTAAKVAMEHYRPPVILDRWNALLAGVMDQGRPFSPLLSESRNSSRLVQPLPSRTAQASNLSGSAPCAISQSSDIPSPSRSG